MNASDSPTRTTPVVSLAQLKAASRKPSEASFFYFDPHFQSNAVKVLPGEYFVCAHDTVIMTVLGSCIAACLWDNRAGIGGMNHFMLPEGDSSDVSARYGSYAMELLINEMQKAGARRESLQAKIFGGAQVMAGFTTMNVGERNTRFVRDFFAHRAHHRHVRRRAGHSSAQGLLLSGQRPRNGQAPRPCAS